MKKIKFTETQTVKFDGRPDLVYEAGKEYELRDDRANRWLRRGVAVEVGAAPAAKPAVNEEQKDKPVESVDFSKSAGSQAFLKGDDASAAEGTTGTKAASESAPHQDQEKNSGNTVASSADVAGSNSGGAGIGSESHTGRGRGGSRGGRSGGGHQSNV